MKLGTRKARELESVSPAGVEDVLSNIAAVLD
jgi:hypothetical protein